MFHIYLIRTKALFFSLYYCVGFVYPCSQVNNRGSPGSKRFRNDASRKDGDWTCPNCGNLNFSFRTVCNQGRCGAPRPPLTPPAPIISPYRNSHPFYYGGVGIPPPSYGMPSQFGSPIPHPGIQYDYGLYARARAPYSPLPMFPPASFGGINYGPRPRIDGYGYGYGFQSPPPPWVEGLIADNFASRKRRGGPDGLFEGDWICPKCDNVNFSFRTTCNIKHCGVVKPNSNKPNAAVVPEGSWTCEKCSNLNYPFRNVCNRKDCRTEKTVSA
ncbi:RanBP2-type zinc finger protein isoform A [Glycine soja]|uniref:RanBP2-type zinc finger protein isoform A n=1 Tax=Glycine soja TaxID=3848 RepID=A0A445FW80_GLYSO|nr:RanBP2-type zinc finger protein isoform A [Glycine soja]